MSKRKTEEQPDYPSKRANHNLDAVLTAIQQRNIAQVEALQSNLNLTLNAFDNTNFTAVIDNSTDGINTLISKQVDLLYFRSAAHYQMGQIRKGFSDAQTMIQLAPSQALGYLRAGQLLSMNGNQKQAIEIYGRGLAMVTGAHKDRLEYQREEAKARLERHVDVISCLPHEILLHILSYLSKNDITKMLGVSKDWQKRVSDPPELWSTLAIHSEPPVWHHLDPVCRHVIILELEGPQCNQAVSKRLLGKFIRLEKLIIHKYATQGNPGLISALAGVSDTLEELLISAVQREQPIELKAIIATCHQLKMLRYTHNYIDRPASLGILPTNYVSSITSLDLDIPYIPKTDIKEILRACPELRALALKQGPPALSQLIRRYCTKLDNLWLFLPLSHHTFIKKGPKTSTGIRNLCLTAADSPCSTALLTENSDTVEELALALPSIFTAASLRLLDQLQSMPQLKALHIKYFVDPANALVRILPKTPRLERIGFYKGFLLSQTTLTLIGRLDCLKELDLVSVGARRSDITDAFHTLTSKGTLQKIRLIHCQFLDDTILTILSNIQSLRYIRIIGGKQVTEQGINHFSKHLQSHPAISALTFEHANFMTDTTLYLLSTLPNLTKLRLVKLKNCTPRGLKFFSGKVDMKVTWV